MLQMMSIPKTHQLYTKIFLTKDENGPEQKQAWTYGSDIGMLNYLATCMRLDYLYAVHQYVHFLADPKLCHERVVKYIARYLKGTKERGIISKPDKSQGIKCFVDADFAGGFTKNTANDPVSVFSQTGYVIYYFGCPIIWISKMQSEISLSTSLKLWPELALPLNVEEGINSKVTLLSY